MPTTKANLLKIRIWQENIHNGFTDAKEHQEPVANCAVCRLNLKANGLTEDEIAEMFR